MKLILVVSLIIGFFFCHMERTWAKPSRYVLETVRKTGKKTEPFDDGQIVRLKNRKTGRVIWSRAVFDYRSSIWSPDGRAVIVSARSADDRSPILLVWRQGYRLRAFGFSYDYQMGEPCWSSDKRRILVRYGGSGNSFFDAGTLHCLKLGSGNFYRLDEVASRVRDMKWKSPKVVSYRTYNPENNSISKPRVWRAP